MNQGFIAGSIDIVVASYVLHASREIPAGLRNVRSLLQPGDHLIHFELTGCLLSHTMIFGVLEGWWLGYEGDRSWYSQVQCRSGRTTKHCQPPGVDRLVLDYT
jgi:hypothetical protein